MAITGYLKLNVNGKETRLYMVTAEAIKMCSQPRIAKKRKGAFQNQVLNRDEKSDRLVITQWGQLIKKYLKEIKGQIRSLENPTGLSPRLFLGKKAQFRYLSDWDQLRLDLITPRLANKKLDDLEREGLASRSLTRQILKNIKCIFNYAVEHGIVRYSPFDRCKNRKLIKKNKQALTHNEVKTLLNEAYRRKHPYYFIWLLALTLGLRRSELAGLKWTDIDFDKRLITVQRQIIPGEGLVTKTKGAVDRVVAIPDYVVATMKKYYRRSKTDFVIETSCQNWRNGNQSLVTRNFCRLIGIKEVTFHQLRATHITLALIDGVPIGIVKANVGHSKLSTTDEYFCSSGIEIQGKTDKLNISMPNLSPLKKRG